MAASSRAWSPGRPVPMSRGRKRGVRPRSATARRPPGRSRAARASSAACWSPRWCTAWLVHISSAEPRPGRSSGRSARSAVTRSPTPWATARSWVRRSSPGAWSTATTSAPVKRRASRQLMTPGPLPMSSIRVTVPPSSASTVPSRPCSQSVAASSAGRCSSASRSSAEPSASQSISVVWLCVMRLLPGAPSGSSCDGFRQRARRLRRRALRSVMRPAVRARKALVRSLVSPASCDSRVPSR